MKRLLPATLITSALVAVAFVASPLGAAPPEPEARPLVVLDDDDDDGPTVKPCVRTTFETEFLEEACAAGGQKAASKAMQGFVKEVKKHLDVGRVNCKSCHTKLAPDFPLTDDGLTKFNDWRQQLADKAKPSDDGAQPGDDGAKPSEAPTPTE